MPYTVNARYLNSTLNIINEKKVFLYNRKLKALK